MADGKPLPKPDRFAVDHWAAKLFIYLLCLIGLLFWGIIILGILT